MNNKNSNQWNLLEDKILKENYDKTSIDISLILLEHGFSRSPRSVRHRKEYWSLKERSVPVTIIKEANPILDDFPVINELTPPHIKAKFTTQYKKISGDIQNALREIREETKRTMSLKDIVIDSENESCVVILSDWHIGKIIKDSVLGEYNIETAVERIRMIPNLVMQTVQHKTIDELILVFAGDLIEGEGIYPGQEINLECAVIDQAKIVTREIWEIVKQFKTIFPLVRIVTCRGNHGRTGQSTEANWDNIIYQQLELLVDMENNQDICIKNMYGNYNSFQVKGWNAIVRHKAPAQANTPAAIAKFSGWSDIHNCDLVIFGHWHHWGAFTWNSKPMFRNGCLAGGDDYSEDFGAHDEPNQLVFCVSKKRLPTMVAPIFFK
jgi:predicted phosphodiesterase